MIILVFNSGSSSLKFALFVSSTRGEPHAAVRGNVYRLGEDGRCRWNGDSGADGEFELSARDHEEAAAAIIEKLQRVRVTAAPMAKLDAVGHRVVHGGELFSSPVRIDSAVLGKIERLGRLAPLHNPFALQAMRAAARKLGERMPMVAVFDTGFFHGLPEHSRRYALPAAWDERGVLRRFGFHGIAHRFLYERYLEASGADASTSRVVTVQLGEGASMAAIHGGAALDTSMGMTPMEGLVMATRCGDVDPGLLLHLLIDRGIEPGMLNDGLNRQAGLLGLSGASADMRELLELEERGHAGAALAVRAYCHRLRKYLGAYFAVLGGADAVVFGGGVGENAPPIRARACANMEWAGLALDEPANAAARGVEARISAPHSATAAYVFPVNEELLIARETQTLLTGCGGR